MMNIKWPFFIIFFVLVPFVIPVYAEVNSFQTDKSLYVLGNKIYFTGSVGIADYQKQVNLVIHDPLGKFILISGNYSNSIYNFEIVVNTNDTNQFSTKGTYSATAFTVDSSSGKTITFDFSPDGSPVIHPAVPPNTKGSNNSGKPMPQHFTTRLSENIAMSDTGGNLNKTKPSPIGNSSTQFDLKNILYPLISLCGVGIVIVVIYFRKINLKSHAQNSKPQQPIQTILSEPEDDNAMLILKNRLAKGEITLDEFKTIKDALFEY